MSDPSSTAKASLWGRAPLAVKIGSAIATLGMVTLVVTLVASAQLSRMDGVTSSLANDNLANIAQIGSVQKAAQATVADVLRHDIANSPADTQAAQQAITDDDKAFDSAWAAYADGSHAASQQQIDLLTSTWKSYRTLRDGTLLPDSRAGRNDAFFTVDKTQAQPLITMALSAIDAMVAAENAAGATAGATAASVYSSSRITLFVLTGVGLLLGGGLGMIAIASVVRPIGRVSDALEAITRGDLTRSVPVSSADEVGRMSRDLNATIASLGTVIRQLARNAGVVATTSGRITEASTDIEAHARTTLERADAVAVTAADVATSAGAAAAGAEEMSASIHEIASSAAEAVKVGTEAVHSAEQTNQRVKELGTSSQQIGDVLSLISSIAEQTNLLALNATIEAARAGDAGKGFAVVATEVKELAQQTASATGDIDQKITAIQDETSAAVTAIAGISGIVNTVNGHQTTIAGAVEEQTAVTSEISRSVTTAAEGAARIADTISGVADSAKATSSAADQAKHAADELAHLSTELTGLVTRFTI